MSFYHIYYLLIMPLCYSDIFIADIFTMSRFYEKSEKRKLSNERFDYESCDP